MRLALVLLLIASTSATAQAQEPVKLTPVVVTAARGAENLGDTLAAVSLITEADIRRLQPLDLRDLVAGLPGVGFTNYGGIGKATSLMLRGANSDHVVVLLDGLKIGSATLGVTSFELIPVDQIERIEIVRGPRSSLYGSEAIGGVIQIFTRRAAVAEAAAPWLDLSGGTLKTGKISAGLRAGISETGWLTAGVTGQTTDGIDVQPEGGEPDEDGFRSVTGSVAAGWRLGSLGEISANFLRADSITEYDGSPVNAADNLQQVAGGRLALAPFQFWTSTLAGGQSRDFSSNFAQDPGPGLPDNPLAPELAYTIADPRIPSTFVTPVLLAVLDDRQIFNTYRNSLSWQNDFQIADGQQLSLGWDRLRDRIDGNTRYAVSSRRNQGRFGQYRATLGRHELQGSLRRDDNEQFGQRRTGGAAYGYRIADLVRLSASYGTAFKAPSFNSLYYPGVGDPGLKPEEAESRELAAQAEHAFGEFSLQWAVNSFRSQIENLIFFVPPTYAAENVGTARIRGTEAQLGLEWQGLGIKAMMTWLDPRNFSGDANDGKRLPLRAKKTARLDADYQFIGERYATFALGFSVVGVGQRYNDTANSLSLPGFATLDVRVTWQPLPGWELHLKGANVLDKRYQTISGFGQPGRTVLAGLRYSPGS